MFPFASLFGDEENNRFQTWLNDPVNKAALLQAGIAMLQPIQPGQSVVGHIGTGVGKGALLAQVARQRELERGEERSRLTHKDELAQAELEYSHDRDETMDRFRAKDDLRADEASATARRRMAIDEAQHTATMEEKAEVRRDRGLSQILRNNAAKAKLKFEYMEGRGLEGLDQTDPVAVAEAEAEFERMWANTVAETNKQIEAGAAAPGESGVVDPNRRKDPATGRFWVLKDGKWVLE